VQHRVDDLQGRLAGLDWMSTGMPRPLSVTVMVLPSLMVTVMWLQ
jgi:hypothetical protein